MVGNREKKWKRRAVFISQFEIYCVCFVENRGFAKSNRLGLLTYEENLIWESLRRYVSIRRIDVYVIKVIPTYVWSKLALKGTFIPIHMYIHNLKDSGRGPVTRKEVGFS
jgi:hypothetical protein